MSNKAHPYPFLSWDEAQRKIAEIQNQGGKVISTNGCFDILHVGHVTYLEQARALGDFLIVGINSDASVKRLKGKDRPLQDEASRAVMLRALRSVDAVCLFEEDTPLAWLQKIKPLIHVKGGDYQVDKLPETPVLKNWGGEVRCLPFVAGYSTSSLIEKFKKVAP